MDCDRAPALVRRAAQGDTEAQHRLFGALLPPLIRFARSKLASDADADDAVQQALLRLFEGLRAYDGQSDVLAWALAITRWECRTVLQRRIRLERHIRKLTADPLQTCATEPWNPEEILLQSDLREEVGRAVGTLRDSDREILLQSFGEYPRTELQLSPDTIRKRRQRALTRLRTVWARRSS